MKNNFLVVLILCLAIGVKAQNSKHPGDTNYIQYTSKEERAEIKAQRHQMDRSFKDMMSGWPDSLKIKRKVKLLPLPVIYSSPETGFAYGVNLQGYWYFGGNKKNNLSNALLTYIYTTKKQYSYRSKWNLFMNSDKIRIIGEASYNHFPLLYYGIGDEITNADDIVEYVTQDYFLLNTDITFRVSDHWLVGGTLYRTNLEKAYITSEEDGGNGRDELFNEAPGNEGYKITGTGLKVIQDSRDNIYYPYKGDYFEAASVFYLPEFGSTMKFNTYWLDYRKFISMSEKKVGRILALQAYARLQYGDVPYREMAGVAGTYGTTNLGRGYYALRYRDKSLIYAHGEYRFPIGSIFKGALFAGGGNVMEEVTDFSMSTFKYNFGGGVRFPFDKENRINLRIDLGFSPEGTGFYLFFAEAF